MIKIKILKTFSKSALDTINQLLLQLALSAKMPKLMTAPYFKRLLAQKNTFLVIAEDVSQKPAKIVGTATVYSVDIPTGTIAMIEDIVVAKEYRGQGIGKRLTEKLIEIAKQKKAKHISVRTNAARVESNAMYLKMGFEQKPTNFYRINLPWP